MRTSRLDAQLGQEAGLDLLLFPGFPGFEIRAYFLGHGLAAMPLNQRLIRIRLRHEVASEPSLKRGIPGGFHRLGAELFLGQHLRRVRPLVDCLLLNLLLQSSVVLHESSESTFGIGDRINRLRRGLRGTLLRLNDLLDLALIRLTLFAFFQQNVQGNVRLGWRRRSNRLWGRLRDDGLNYWLGCWLCLRKMIRRNRLEDRLDIGRQS